MVGWTKPLRGKTIDHVNPWSEVTQVFQLSAMRTKALLLDVITIPKVKATRNIAAAAEKPRWDSSSQFSRLTLDQTSYTCCGNQWKKTLRVAEVASMTRRPSRAQRATKASRSTSGWALIHGTGDRNELHIVHATRQKLWREHWWRIWNVGKGLLRGHERVARGVLGATRSTLRAGKHSAEKAVCFAGHLWLKSRYSCGGIVAATAPVMDMWKI